MEDDLGNITYEFLLDYSSYLPIFLTAMKKWDKPDGKYLSSTEAERLKAENAIQYRLKSRQSLIAYNVYGMNIGRPNLECFSLFIKVGDIYSEGEIEIAEYYFSKKGTTNINSTDFGKKGIVFLRQTKGTYFKIKELFNKYHTKSFW